MLSFFENPNNLSLCFMSYFFFFLLSLLGFEEDWWWRESYRSYSVKIVNYIKRKTKAGRYGESMRYTPFYFTQQAVFSMDIEKQSYHNTQLQCIWKAIYVYGKTLEKLTTLPVVKAPLVQWFDQRFINVYT